MLCSGHQSGKEMKVLADAEGDPLERSSRVLWHFLKHFMTKHFSLSDFQWCSGWYLAQMCSLGMIMMCPILSWESLLWQLGLMHPNRLCSYLFAHTVAPSAIKFNVFSLLFLDMCRKNSAPGDQGMIEAINCILLPGNSR